MIKMKYKRKTPGKIHGVGEFEPGKEYLLPDIVAKGLIETKDPDGEQVKESVSAAQSAMTSRQASGKRKEDKDVDRNR